MHDRMDETIPARKRQRASTFRVAPAPIVPAAATKPSPHGVGSRAGHRYCPCGAKKRDGRCVRGCEA